MIENIFVDKVNDNFYRINIKQENGFSNLNLELENCYIPFGVEEFYKKYYLNFEVDKNEEFIKMIRLLEKNLLNLLEINEDLDLKSVFHKKARYNLLCKCNIKKNKNLIISKYINNNIETSVFEIEKKKNYKINIEVSGIWIYKNTYGLTINILKVY